MGSGLTSRSNNSSATSTFNNDIMNVKRRFMMLQDQLPELDAATAWTLSESGGADEELLRDATKAIAIGAMPKSVENLKNESKDKQRSMWGGMSTQRQQLYLDNGYVPVEAGNSSEDTWFNTIGHGLGWGWDHSFGWLGKKVVGPDSTIGMAAKALSVPLGLVTRSYRDFSDRSSENQDSRIQLMLNDAQTEMEKKGIKYTDDEWNYLKWKFIQDNPYNRTKTEVSGGTDTLSNITNSLNAGNVGTALSGQLGQGVNAENMFDKMSRSPVNDALYNEFSDTVKVIKERAKGDYNVGANDSWERVSQGDTYTRPVDLLKQQEKLDDPTGTGYHLMDYLSKNKTLEEYLSNVENLTPDTPEYAVRGQQLSDQWLGNKDWKEGFKELTASSSKVSPGRDIAGALGIQKDTLDWNLTSGLLDASFIMLVDPVLLAGKGFKIGRILQNGVPVEQIPEIGKAYARSRGILWGSAVVDGTENINKVNTVFENLHTNPWFVNHATENNLNVFDKLLDINGMPTPFLMENFDAINASVNAAQSEALTTLQNGSRVLGVPVNELSTLPVAELNQVNNVNDAIEAMNSLDIMKAFLGRSAEAEPSMRKLGTVASWLRDRDMERQFQFIDRAVEAFKTRPTDNLAMVRFMNEVPRGVEWVSALDELDKALIARRGTGIQNGLDIYQWLEGRGLLGLQTGELNGLAIKGFGNGTAISNDWLLFGKPTDVDLAFNRNELVQMPKMSEYIRPWIEGTNTFAERVSAIGQSSKAIRLLSAPIRAVADLKTSLTELMPRGEVLSLDRTESIINFKKELASGAFMGMDKATREGLLEQYIRGIPNYINSPLRFTGDVNKLTDVVSVLKNVPVDSADNKLFVAKFNESISNLIDEHGVASDFFRENYFEIRNFVKSNNIVSSNLGVNTNKVSEAIDLYEKVPHYFSSDATRMAVQNSFLREAFKRMKFYDTPTGKEVVEGFINDLNNYRYSANDEDLMTLGSSIERVALLPVMQHSSQMAMPTFEATQEATAKMGSLNTMAKIMRAINRPVLDKFMQRYWRPAILVRGGFIPSVGGDEYLAYLARRGLWAPLSNMAYASARDSRGLLTGTIAGVVRKPAKFFGEVYRDGLADDLYKVSHVLKYGSVSEYMDNVAETVLGETRTASSLGGWDHIALTADYHTANVIGAIRGLQFNALPQRLQLAVAGHAAGTSRADLIQNAGLLELAASDTKFSNLIKERFFTKDPISGNSYMALNPIAETLMRDANALMRNDYARNSLSKQIEESMGHSNMMNEDLSGAITPERMAIRKNAYDRTPKMVYIEVNPQGKWSLIDSTNEENLGQLAYTYGQYGADPVGQAWFHEVAAGRLTETALLQDFLQNLDRRVFVPPSGGATVDVALEQAEKMRMRISKWNRSDRESLQRFLQHEKALGLESEISPTFNETGFQWSDLTPTEQSYLQNLPPNSEFEKLLIRLLKDEKFIADNNLEGRLISKRADLNSLMNMNKGTASAIIGDRPIRVLDPITFAQETDDAMLRALQDPELAHLVNDNRRVIYHSQDGRPVVNPLPNGTQSTYAVMADKFTNDAITAKLSAPNGVNDLLNEIAGLGASKEQLQMINWMFTNWDQEMITQLRSAQEGTRNAILIPVSPVGFKNFNDAENISRLFDSWAEYSKSYPTDNTSAPFAKLNDLRVITPGRIHLSPQQQQLLNAIPGSNQQYVVNDNVLLNKFEPYVNGPTIRVNDMGVIDPNGAHVLQGATREEALKAWAQKLSESYRNIYMTPRGDLLHELIEPSRRGYFDRMTLRAVATDRLPVNLYAPEKFAMVEANRWERLVKFGWDRMINPPLQAIVRQPMFLLSFGDGLEAARAATSSLRNPNLDKTFGKVIKKLGMNEEEIRNIWSHINPNIKNNLQLQDFKNQLRVLHSEGFLHDASPLIQDGPIDAIGVANPTELEIIFKWAKYDSNVENLVVKTASERAINDVIPYIHDHRNRSYFQSYVRNLMPFEFAQEQFAKRWIKSTLFSPEAFRRAQLVEHGLSSNVLTREDEYGNAVISVPASEALGEILAKTPIINSIWGGAAKVPVSTPLTMNVKEIVPDVIGEFSHLPNLSPIATLPANYIVNHFPEFAGGQQQGRNMLNTFSGAGRDANTHTDVLDAVVPHTWLRAWSALVTETGSSTKEINATAIAAIQQMEAEAIRLRVDLDKATEDGNDKLIHNLQKRINQLSLPNDASPELKNEYLDNVRDWAKANLLTRAVTGFMMPAPVSTEFKDKHFSSEFKDLLEHFSFEEAIGIFLAENPEGLPYTLFTTKKDTTAPIPPTEAAVNWMDNNQDLLRAYPQAAPWLMPLHATKNEYSAQAYNEEIGSRLRHREDLKEWYGSFKYAAGANVYFPKQQEFETEIALSDDPNIRKSLQAEWDSWSMAFKNQNPIFADELSRNTNNNAEGTMKQLKEMMNNPSISKVPQTEGLLEAIKNYEDFATMNRMLSGDNSKIGRIQSNELKMNFLKWGNQFVIDNPELRSLWFSVIIPATNLRSFKFNQEVKGYL